MAKLSPKLRRHVWLVVLAAAGTLGAQQQTQGAGGYPPWPPQAGPIAPLDFTPFSAGITVSSADFSNSVVAGTAQPGPLALTLDDAIRRALAQNLGLRLNSDAEQVAAGRAQQSRQALFPILNATAYTSVNQVDLAAEGFRPGTFAGLSGAGNISLPAVIKFQATNAQLNLNWTPLNIAALKQYRNQKVQREAARLTTVDSRETVVLNVANAYLQALADNAEVENAQALLKADQAQLNTSTAEHIAGVAAHLDELRARVQVAQQEQAVVYAQRNFERDKIAIERLTGIPPDQEITLPTSVPFAELDTLELPELETKALATRADLGSAEQRVKAAELRVKAARAERLPTFGFGGYYGVIGPTHGPYHGDFVAAASLRIPIFQEAKFRGDRDVARASVVQNQTRVENLKESIRADLRTALLDMTAARQNVALAQSNVALVQTELDQSAQRFAAGVQDNLPVVESQADVASAQDRLVQANYTYNLAKLRLARAMGLADASWQEYLGSGR